MRGIMITMLGFGLLLVNGCASSSSRLPASFKPKYNSQIVRSLTTAAVNQVLFQVDDQVFRDVDTRQIDECRTRETPTWSKTFLTFLNLMDKHPEFYQKFNVVELKAGDKASVEITEDIDGLSRLNILYGKKLQNEKVTATTHMPCSEAASEYLGKGMVITSIEWPNPAEMLEVLRRAPPRKKVERFQFNTEFLVYLAEHQAILKINPEVAFERTFKGDYFLISWLDDLAKQIKNQKFDQDYVTYWFSEIAGHSAEAKHIQFFGLHPEADAVAGVGVQVDTAGAVARKINNDQVPTYLFMSYRQQNGEYIYGDMQDLNSCLQRLTDVYRNPLSLGTSLERSPASFLAPEFPCPVKTGTD